MWIKKEKLQKIHSDYQEQIKELYKKLDEKSDLKDILECLSDKIKLSINGVDDINWWISWWWLSLGDDVAVYVDDLIDGGKVIKQEGNKAIIIDKEWNIKTGLTKKKTNKWYKYVLVRK